MNAYLTHDNEGATRLFEELVTAYPDHPNVFYIQNVPNRDGIMIHIGNFATGSHIDTEGCQLPCMSFEDIDGNGSLDGFRPDVAMLGLNENLPNSFKLIIC